MRCKKCNRSLGLFQKFCSKCGAAAEKTPPGQVKNKIITFLAWLVAFGLLIPVMYYFASHGASADQYTFEDNLLGATIVAFFAACALYLVYKLVIFGIRRPVWGVVIGVLILMPVVGGFLAYRQYYSTKQFTDAVALIQEQMNQVAAAKLMGDSIVAKKTIPGSSLATVKSMAELAGNRLDFMALPEELSDYRDAVVQWSRAIATAADDKKIWNSVGRVPRGFELRLSQGRSEKLFEDSVEKITELKEFGDSAIGRKDRVTMLYIAAKLLVQEHWLSSILYSENAGFLSFNLVSPALAALPTAPPVGDGIDVTCRVCADPNVRWTAELRRQYGCDTRCNPTQKTNQGQNAGGQNQNTSGQQNQNTAGNNQPNGGVNTDGSVSRKVCIGRGGTSTGNTATNVYCIEDVISSTYGIDSSAIGIAQGETGAKNGWNSNWHNLEGTGVTVGEPDNPNAGQSPKVRQFYDACAAKGGIVGGAGTVKAGLPTTESGYTCEYKSDTPRNGTQPCWDFLTYSGGRYMGGNTGCPAQNLLPTKLDEKKVKALGGKWDGVYAVGGGTVTCSGDFSQAIQIPATTAPVVNSILDTTQGPIPIGGNTASWSTSITRQQENSVANINEIDTFRFYQSGSTVGVSATYSATIVVTGEDWVQVATCYGSVGGARVSN